MKKDRITAGFLAVLLAMVPLASCTKGKDPGTDKRETVADSGAAYETEAATEGETGESVEAGLNRIGEVDGEGRDFNILYVDDITGYPEEIRGSIEEDDEFSSGIISSAVHERNVLFEERCRVKLDPIPSSSAGIFGKVQNEVRTKSGDFHLITADMMSAANMATSALLYDYGKLPIDYEEKSWWDQGMLDFALDGQVFLMHGGFDIVDNDVTFLFFFNKELQKEYRLPDMYETVWDGKWTLDYMSQTIAEMPAENGDGVWDKEDRYGFAAPPSVNCLFFYGADLKYVRNSRDMASPELMLDAAKMDKATTLLHTVNTLLHGGDHLTFVSKPGVEYESLHVFLRGDSLFYTEAASYLRYMNTDMKSDYGVIPIPKYDEAQTHYRTITSGNGSCLSIPTNAPGDDPELFGKILETYALLSQKYVYPAYYDQMLKTRTLRDPESADMMNLIFRHRVYDMGLYFHLGIKGFAECVARNSDAFVSTYTASTKNFDRMVGRLLKNLRRSAET